MDLTNRLCVVTGANSGIGKETVRDFARRGAYVIMVCRNEARANQARREIVKDTGHTGLEIVLADLAVQYDIRRAAEEITAQFDHVDILVNNAGYLPNEREVTADGIEKTLAVNHLAPFLLTKLLLNSLQQAKEARVITVSSEVHRLGARVFDLDNLQLKNNFSPMKAYGLSKLCNIMFTYELAKQTHDDAITANCLHPGVVSTQLSEEAGWATKLFYLMGKPFMRSPEGGAQTSIYLATSDEVQNVSGRYFKNKQLASPSNIAFDDKKTAQLWEQSNKMTEST